MPDGTQLGGVARPDCFGDLLGIVHVYRLILRRPADRPGLRHHLELVAAGGSLADVVDGLRGSGEGLRIWGRQPDECVARAVWATVRETAPAAGAAAAGPLADGAAGDGEAGFRAAWERSGGLPYFVEALVATEAVRRAPVVAALFPDGVDPLDHEIDRDWAYRLWSIETERALGAIGRRLFPLLRLAGPVIGLVIELAADDPADAIAVTLESLRRQIYGRWRVRIHGAPPRGVALPADPRVAIGAGLPAGRWVGWLRAGDTLSEAALALFAWAALRRPAAAALYCDEDRVDAGGIRSAPWLKRAWDRPAAERFDVTGGLTLFRRGGKGLDGDARARAARLSAARSGVVHLPAVLCHRAAGMGTAGMGAAGIGAVGAGAGAGGMSAGRAGGIGAAPLPRVSVVIATRDRAPLLDRCVRALRGCTDYPDLEIVLVDNGSVEPDACALLRRLGGEGCVVLRRPGAFNWSALNNAGVARSSGEIVVLMNNDVFCIEPGWLRAMVAASLRPRAGVVGALLLFEDGRVQHAGVVVGPGPHAAHVWSGGVPEAAPVQSFAGVTGACMAIGRTVFERFGGLDERLPVTWNDIDFCLRVREAGLRVTVARDAVLVHVESATRTADSAPENQAQLARTRRHVAARHRRALRCDPFLNPLLTARDGGRFLDPAAPERMWELLRRGGR